MDDFPFDEDYDLDPLYEDDERGINDDCNESQPCRGDEPWLDHFSIPFPFTRPQGFIILYMGWPLEAPLAAENNPGRSDPVRNRLVPLLICGPESLACSRRARVVRYAATDLGSRNIIFAEGGV